MSIILIYDAIKLKVTGFPWIGNVKYDNFLTYY